MNSRSIHLGSCNRRCPTCFDYRITAAADRAVRMCERARPRKPRAQPQPDGRIERVQANPQLTPGFGVGQLARNDQRGLPSVVTSVRPLPRLSPGPRRPM